VSRRIRLLSFVLLCVLAPFTAGFGPPRQDESPITIQLDAGYGLRFRGDQWLPLRLTLSNDGPDVRGSLRVRSESNPGLSATTYSTPIDLPNQSRKQVFLYISIQSFARQVMVELVDAEGEVLATQGSQLLPANPADILTAVVTDSPSGSIDLSGIDLGGGESYQANWTVENLPPRADSLQGLDVIFFSDVDTGRLSLEQQRALRDWVLSGGHLIVSGGPNYRLTTAGLIDLLPVEITGTATLGDLSPLAAFAGRVEDSLVEPDVIVATGTLIPGAQSLVQVQDTTVLARRTWGEGFVDFLAADPGLAPFRRWRSAEDLWAALIVVPYQIPSWSSGVQDWSTARTVVQETPGFDLPTALQMIGLLLIYIVVIGPVNYVVLVLIRRREWAWFTIPLLVVAFSVISYFTGFSLRGTRATLNRLSLIQVWPGESRAQVDGLVGVLSPRRGVYQLSAPEGFTLRPLPEDTGGVGGFSPVQLATQIEQASVFNVRDLLVDASFVAGFVTSGYIDNAPQVGSDVTLIYNENGSAHVQGTVTNTTGFPLEDAVLLVRGGFQHLGTLEPGAQAGFDLPLTSRQSAPLSLVNNEEGGFYFERLDLTAQDVLGPGYNATSYYDPSPELRARRLRQRQDFLRAIAPDADFSGGRGDRVYLVAWGGESPLDLTLEGAALVYEDMTAYVFALPVGVDAPEGPLTITPGFSTYVTLPDTTTIGARPYDLSVNMGEQAAFRFIPLPTAILNDVTRIDVTVRRTSSAPAFIYVWDWIAENWVQLDPGGDIRTTIDTPDRYLGPSNAVEVLVVPDNLAGFADFGQIDVTWHGTF
jgi:hypothetical protein